MSKCGISWAYLDRLNDVCESDTLERIMGDLKADMQRQFDEQEASSEAERLDSWRPSYGSNRG